MAREPSELRLPPAVRATLEAFVRGLRESFGDRVQSVRLFGSYARGEATEESDVDCLVLLDTANRQHDIAITNLAADLIWQLEGVVISPMVMSVAEFEAWKSRERATPLAIEREGVLL